MEAGSLLGTLERPSESLGRVCGVRRTLNDNRASVLYFVPGSNESSTNLHGSMHTGVVFDFYSVAGREIFHILIRTMLSSSSSTTQSSLAISKG